MDNELLMVLAAFAAHQQMHNRAARTIIHYRRVLSCFARWFDGKLLAASREDVTGYLDSLRVVPRTRYQYLSCLSTFFGWALDEGHIESNPCRRIPRPQRPRDLPRPIARGDLHIAVSLAGPRMRCWLLLGGFAGLRCKEIAGIMVDDIRRDLDTPTLIVSAPKGHRERAVPLHPDLELALADYGIPRAGWLFPAQQNPGRPVAPWNVSHGVATFLREIGINATSHQLRHFFASSVYRASHDILLVQNLLGHASPTTTAVYAQWDQTRAAEVIGSLALTESGLVA